MNRAARRLPEIDRLRGFVIVLMALDHMRDFFDADTMRFLPTDLDRTYPLLFFTRIVTHLCAPTFALLAGLGAYLYGARIKDGNALTWFLVSRGIWLILLDAIIISPIWTMGAGRIELGTLWAIGCGLLALAALSRLQAVVSLATGAAIIAGHNLLDGVHAEALGALGPWWRLLHEQGALPLGIPGGVHYPALPWIGAVLLGYGIGPLLARPQADRDRAFVIGGAVALAAFVAVRLANGYGDPHPWSSQRDALFTFLSFLNVSKYPPSLDYLLLTLGFAALLLPFFGKLGGRIGDFLSVFGRTPLFFYVLHLYFGVGAALALTLAHGWTFSDLAGFAKNGPPPDFGYGLPGAYLAWAVIIIALYPLCRWFDGLKSRRPEWWWLSYL